MKRSTAGRPRTPGIVYTALAVAMAVVVAVIAISANQPPPPTIAEFAPQALEQIKEAPAEQSGDAGQADGQGGGARQAAQLAAAKRLLPPIDAPRVRRCVGNPPRQIEDPQSPPCVAYWKGDNGGATTKGVTRDTIKIAVPYEEGQVGNPLTAKAKALEAFFNRRFEFYGRKIVLFKVQGKDHEAQNPDPAKQRADAVEVDSRGAFASTAYAEQGGIEYEYHDELARRKIISSFSAWPVQTSEDHFSARAPYEWAPQPGGTEIGRVMGEWICKQLAGKNAVHAGQENYRQSKRKFGVIVARTPDGRKPNLTDMYSRLEGCAATPAVTVEIRQTSDAQDVTVQHTNAVLKLQQEGVTSVISFNQYVHLHLSQQQATNANYYPEWLVSSYEYQTDEFGAHFAGNPPQLDNTFGFRMDNKILPQADRPVHWAMRESNPNEDGENGDYLYLYAPLLIIASGIQMAGPRLTPKTFAEGLARTRFPNPRSGIAPYYQAHVSLGPRDHSFYDDAAFVWWNSNETSNLDGLRGKFCQIPGRYMPGQLPSGDQPFFKGQCL
jgi:hypothetical protein